MLSHELLKEVLNYCQDTGVFTWVKSRGSARQGAIAGCPDKDGYICIKLDGRLYKAHRLAWFWINGKMPIGQIDHNNRKRSDNRGSNLTEVSQHKNQQNTSNRTDNTSGVKGVSFHKPTMKWAVRISVSGKRKSVGHFDDFDEAVCARLAAEQCIGWVDKNSTAYLSSNSQPINKQ